jgi:hypothetical protein
VVVVARGGVGCERAAVGAALEFGADARGEPVGCRRRQAIMGRMRTHKVVVLTPVLDEPPRLAQAGEDLLVQQLVPQPADEALGERVLLGLARRDVMPGDAGPVGPSEDRARGQLGAVVARRAK